MNDKLPYYCGERRPNCDYHHGQLPPVRGAGCYQVTRANRTHPEWDDGTGDTYKHGADLAYWKGSFYLHYFTNPVSEHRAGSERPGLLPGRHALEGFPGGLSALPDPGMHGDGL